MRNMDDDRDLAAKVGLGAVALAGFLAAHIFAQINTQIADHEIRIRTAEVALAGRINSKTPEAQ